MTIIIIMTLIITIIIIIMTPMNHLCQVVPLLFRYKQGFRSIVQDSLSTSLSKSGISNLSLDIKPFKHVTGIVPIQLAIVDQTLIKLQN